MTILLFILLAVVLVGTQLLLGGKEPTFSLPGYGLLALAGVLSMWPLRRVAVSRRMLWNVATTFAFFGCIAIRALFSEDHYLARKDLYLALAVLIVYLLVVLNVTSPRLRVALVGILLLLGVVDTAIGAIQYQRGDGFTPFEFLRSMGYGPRARGFFGCPNHLAGFLEVVVMLGLSVTLWSSWPWWGSANPDVVAHFVDHFEMLWAMGQHWDGATAAGDPMPIPLDDEELAILRFLDQGLTMDAIANRLGVSERTLSNRLAHLKGKFNVASLYALGSRWQALQDSQSIPGPRTAQSG